MMVNKSRVRAAGRAAHWLADLDTLQVQFLILSARHDGAMINAVRNDAAWRVDHDDGDTILFTRAVPPSQMNRSEYAASSTL